MAEAIPRGPQGGTRNPIYTGRAPLQLANGSAINPSPATNPGSGWQGPGPTMPAGYQQQQQAWQQQQQLQESGGSGPVEIEPGVYVWPNGQQLTPQEVQSLNLEGVVSQGPTNAAELLAQEEATAAVPATATAAPATTSASWLDENTITASYTNGQVLLAAGAVLGLVYLFKKR